MFQVHELQLLTRNLPYWISTVAVQLPGERSTQVRFLDSVPKFNLNSYVGVAQPAQQGSCKAPFSGANPLTGYLYSRLAQLAEQLVYTEKVESANLSTGTNYAGETWQSKIAYTYFAPD